MSDPTPARRPPHRAAPSGPRHGMGRAERASGTTAIPRLHLFEFEDLPWLPQTLREGIIEALGFLMRTLRVYDLAFPTFARWAQGQARVVDIGSGSGMHIDDLARWAARHGSQTLPRVVLSDLQPNLGQFGEIAQRHPELVGYEPSPVDASDLPDHLAPLPRSMFSSFHHLRPAEATALLADAARHNAGLFIFDPVARTPANILSNLLGLIFGVIAPFFARRRSWRKILLSTLVPVIPVMLSFDGVVSALRGYSVAEVEAMIRGLPPNDLDWDVFPVRGHGALALFTGLCIVATPTRAARPA